MQWRLRDGKEEPRSNAEVVLVIDDIRNLRSRKSGVCGCRSVLQEEVQVNESASDRKKSDEITKRKGDQLIVPEVYYCIRTVSCKA